MSGFATATLDADFVPAKRRRPAAAPTVALGLATCGIGFGTGLGAGFAAGLAAACGFATAGLGSDLAASPLGKEPPAPWIRRATVLFVLTAPWDLAALRDGLE